MSGPATFSYAQAAKGASSQPPSQSASSPAPPSTSSLSKDDTASTAATTTSSTSDQHDSESTIQATSATDGADSETTQLPPTNTTAPPISISSSQPVALDDVSLSESVATSGDRPSQPSASTQANRGQDDAAPKRNRKSKKSRNADKDDQGQGQDRAAEKEPVKVELFEAPPPSVNIWHKRAEAHGAKSVKPSAPANTTNAGSVSSDARATQAKPNHDASIGSTAPPTSNGLAPPATKAQRRPNEGVAAANEQIPRGRAPRGSRLPEHDEKHAQHASMPSVEDAVSWPSVMTAITGEEGKPKAADKFAQSNKDGNDEASSKPRQKEKWVTMEFVPSVNFATPLPGARGTKPRGGARGGREATGRIPQSTAPSHKGPTTVASTSDKAMPESQDRKDASASVRGSSLGPPSSKRLPGEPPNPRQQRKLSISTQGERPAAGIERESVNGNKVEIPARGSRHDLPNGDHYRTFADRRSPEHPKEGGFQQSREGGSSHRERHDGRAERGGRGGKGYRNANHAGHSAQNHMSQSYTFNRYQSAAPFSPQQSISYGSPQPFGYGGPSSSKSVRGSARTQSLSNASGYRQNGNLQRLPSLQTANYYEYGNEQNGTATFPPLSNNNDHAILEGILLQIEYYFSVDNLCKDQFLRTKMDSQGFVPLTTVAGFKRVQALAPNYLWITTACENSNQLEFVTTENGDELIRSRLHWDKFVLPVEGRNDVARKPGPDLTRAVWRSNHVRAAQYQSTMMVSSPYASMSPDAFSPGMGSERGDAMYANMPNGVHASPNGVRNANGHAVNGFAHPAESSLSADVPSFSPGTSGNAPLTLEDFQNFSDDQVAKVVARTNSVGTNGTSEAGDSTSNVFGEITYPDLRSSGLDKRGLAEPGDTPSEMRDLYQFWSHLLLDGRFNVAMYDEFRRCALEDGRKEVPSKFGLKSLLGFYKAITADGKPQYPEVFSSHRSEAQRVVDSWSTKV